MRMLALSAMVMTFFVIHTESRGSESVPAVVVELFTSEGCSSCPPADALLSEMAERSPVQGVEFIPLSLHVDYWNRLGWTDPFSMKQFSDRQGKYSEHLTGQGIYTPQLVVNGKTDCVGSDREAVIRQVSEAAATKRATLGLKWTKEKENRHLNIEWGNLPAGDAKYALMLAVTEDGLETKVDRGENAGKALRHDGVVRQLEDIGAVDVSVADRTKDHLVAVDPSWKPEHLHVVVFLQNQETMEIVAAATIKP